jgi:hypothetical protein
MFFPYIWAAFIVSVMMMWSFIIPVCIKTLPGKMGQGQNGYCSADEHACRINIVIVVPVSFHI